MLPNLQKGETEQAVGISQPCLLLSNPAEGTLLTYTAAFQEECWFADQWMHGAAFWLLPLTTGTQLSC